MYKLNRNLSATVARYLLHRPKKLLNIFLPCVDFYLDDEKIELKVVRHARWWHATPNEQEPFFLLDRSATAGGERNEDMNERKNE
jgi:hypothetical protein